MSTTGQHPDMPHLESVESDPAYDYAEDVPISVDDWDAEDEFLDADKVVVPTPPVAVDAEERVVPLDEDEFRGTE
ncbi:hypothetical protein [Pseudarthrobacter raffinosi]|uniref:hypothetical protein n=1 Tax=Pseudarthrobacter raffinosi TaxID=2953651 RepID=UPI00208FC842|nr:MULTISPECIES: hypothetical protein [unclassified Pseudarthrobacter]MCO4237030.1 hypothetical protein [Pseudarthrobacter sp. MDT3-28]MCO4250760.1 hypothetical protein [Pseudarthrobacter sp. MDT3-9]MCO4261638.1 hypothetical protein [Pseudarthrobacter sp. MDT3-26]